MHSVGRFILHDPPSLVVVVVVVVAAAAAVVALAGGNRVETLQTLTVHDVCVHGCQHGCYSILCPKTILPRKFSQMGHVSRFSFSFFR